MQDRRMSVRMISEAVGISIGTVDSILTEDMKLHKVCPVEEWSVVVPSGQCLMPLVNAGDYLHGQRVYETGTTPTLQPWPSPLRLLPVPTHERQPQGNQISVNRGAEKGIGNLSEKITEGGLRGGVPGLEATHEECRYNYFEGDKVLLA